MFWNFWGFGAFLIYFPGWYPVVFFPVFCFLPFFPTFVSFLLQQVPGKRVGGALLTFVLLKNKKKKMENKEPV